MEHIKSQTAKNQTVMVSRPQDNLSVGSFWTQSGHFIKVDSHEDAILWTAILNQIPEQVSGLGQANLQLLHAVAGLAAMNMDLRDRLEEVVLNLRAREAQSTASEWMGQLVDGKNSIGRVKLTTSVGSAEERSHHWQEARETSSSKARQWEIGLQGTLAGALELMSGLQLGVSYSQAVAEASQQVESLSAAGHRSKEQSVVQEIEIENLNRAADFEAMVEQVAGLEDEKSTLGKRLLRWRLLSITSWATMLWMLFGESLTSLPF